MKNSSQAQRKGLASVLALNRVFPPLQTDSAEISTGSELSSYYYLNGFQLWCDVFPKVNKTGQVKITLNGGGGGGGVEGEKKKSNI